MQYLSSLSFHALNLLYHHDYGSLFYFELHDEITNSEREKKEKTSIAFENKFQRNNQFEEKSIFIYTLPTSFTLKAVGGYYITFLDKCQNECLHRKKKIILNF